MPLESGTYIADLVATNPTSTDPKSAGDDHLRLLKAVLQATFAGFAGMIVVTGTEAAGATANDYAVAVSPAPGAYTPGMVAVFIATHANTGAVTLSISGLASKPVKAVDGASDLDVGDIFAGSVVAALYDGTQFVLVSGNDRARRDGDTYNGTHDMRNATLMAKTQTAGSSTNEVATTAFVSQMAFHAALPEQPGDDVPKALITQNGVASWGATSDLPLFAIGTI